MSATRVAALALVLAAACHHHRDANAPRLSDPAVPPRDPSYQGLEYPDDPGERMVMLTTGGLGGVFGGSIDGDAAVIDLAAEATLSWGESAVSHNDQASRLFIPRGVVLPPRSTAVTLGWSGVRVVMAEGADTEVRTGPLYVEVQRSGMFAGVAAGWAFDPVTRGTGPQVNAYYAFYYLRGRALFGDGWELGGGLQLKIPTTWVWTR
jgi:hypothetical protein